MFIQYYYFGYKTASYINASNKRVNSSIEMLLMTANANKDAVISSTPVILNESMKHRGVFVFPAAGDPITHERRVSMSILLCHGMKVKFF